MSWNNSSNSSVGGEAGNFCVRACMPFCELAGGTSYGIACANPTPTNKLIMFVLLE